MARLPALVLLVTALVVLVISLIAMGVLLIGHEKLPFFAGADCSVHRERNEQRESRQNQPLMVLLTSTPPFCCAVVARDDEQTRHDTHVYKMVLRRIKPTERCYKERHVERLSTMDNATKGRDTYETDRPAVL
jgi:hypothetical protein